MKIQPLRMTWLAVVIGALSLGIVFADSAHTGRDARPIPMGSSGGSIEHIDFPFCCGGTFGAVVEDATGAQFILSNNHVIARVNRGASDEDMVQPGLIDVGCQQIAGDIVADLADYVPIQFNSTNQVDAAIARVRAGMVRTDGYVKDIGTLSPNTVAASLGQPVKKSGRTTGLTHGQVSAVDVTVNVGYAERCGRQANKTATFINQFLVTPGDFSAGGDSGSVIVEDLSSDPRAVGLLFAGSSSYTVANPIDAVLSAFGVAMVGGTAPDPPATGSIAGTVWDNVTNTVIVGALVEVDTGQSDTTNGSGDYVIADVPTGERTVTASATGYESVSQMVTVSDNTTTTADLFLTPTPDPDPGASLACDCITYESYGGRNSDKHLRITAAIVDETGSPAAGVGVTAEISRDTVLYDTVTATTDSSGHAVFELKNAPNGTYTTDVIDIASSGDVTEPTNSFDKGGGLTFDQFCVSPSLTTSLAQHPDSGQIGRAIAIKRRHEALLFAASTQVVGVGVGAASGEAVIEVYLASGDPSGRSQLPARLEGVRVQSVITGPFVAGLECQQME